MAIRTWSGHHEPRAHHQRARIRMSQALACISGIEPRAAGAMSLVLCDGRRVELRFHVEAGWAELTASLPGDLASSDPWEALASTVRVEGVAKLSLTPGGCGIEIRADVAMGDDADPAPALAAAVDDMRSLAAALAGSSGAGTVAAAGESAIDAGPASGARVDLRALVSETSWSFVERDPDRLAVDLAIPDRFQQAFITPSRSGRTLARATLAMGALPTAASRRALGVLMLTASTAIRLVRPGIVIEGADARLVVEAYLDPDPDAADLDAALGALATACRIAGREARALFDERVARIYLAARGWAA
jgi:hypothetical protein